MTVTAPYISMTGMTKSFAGIQVLKGIDLDVRPGEVHALLGENGAGKSTLIKIIAGLIRPDGGRFEVQGDEVRFTSTRDSIDTGIATIHQELLLFPDLSIAENVFLGNYPRKLGGVIDWKIVRARTRALLDQLDSHDLDVDAKVLTLSIAQRQRVEIAKALSKKARILIMDEPTAALVEADVQRLMIIVKQLREQGVGIVYVSHRMPEIFALADRVTVIRDGAYVATTEIGEVNEGDLVSMMVGRSIENLFPKKDAGIGAPVLSVRNLNRGYLVRDISFTLHRGEILGIAGLVGSGRTELALTLFGMTPARSGEIIIDGETVLIPSPLRARDLGIAYVPEDRAHQGLVRAMSIFKNVTMASMDKVASGIFLRSGCEHARAASAVRNLSVRCRDLDQTVGELSGGNQQKVVISKWLETTPKVLILDEPTRGVDVGAKAEIHSIMSELVQTGVSILMISSELPEVLGMSDRVLVMSGGRITDEIDRSEATPERVGAAMTAHKPEEVALT